MWAPTITPGWLFHNTCARTHRDSLIAELQTWPAYHHDPKPRCAQTEEDDETDDTSEGEEE